MNLGEISLYRSKAMEKLIENQRIRDYITNTPNTDINPKDLLLKNIFPYWHYPGEKVDSDNYILMSIYTPNVYHKTIKRLIIEIGIMCNEHHLQCVDPDSGLLKLRYDLLAFEIDKMFNGSFDFGFKLNLVSSEDVNPMDGFYGVLLTYDTDDFNYQSRTMTYGQ